jgi:hypothetical protein
VKGPGSKQEEATLAVLEPAQLQCTDWAACGGKSQVDVRGKATFKGQPVTEGTILFNDDQTGQGAEVELRADGSSQATSPPGRYAVVIVPPLVSDWTKSLTSPAGEEYPKVANIPGKYRSTTTSNLSAVIRADQAVDDLDLTSP